MEASLIRLTGPPWCLTEVAVDLSQKLIVKPVKCRATEEFVSKERKLLRSTLKPQQRSPAGHQLMKCWLDAGWLKSDCCCNHAEQVVPEGSWATGAATVCAQKWLVEFIWGKLSPPQKKKNSLSAFLLVFVLLLLTSLFCMQDCAALFGSGGAC